VRIVRKGWTLHEMIISLAVTGAVLALAVHAALGQLRFFHGVGEITNLRGQLAQTTLVPRALLWGVSPVAGDIAVAQDTALELNVVTGTAVVCESAAGWVAVPAPTPEGNTLSAFSEAPQPDDRIAALLDDTAGTTWLRLRVAVAPVAGLACPAFSAATSAWRIGLVEQVALPVGAVIRFLRPMRLSAYRASDGRWYLGARDWNAASSRFNTIQPLAGPIDPPASDRSVTGFRFEYFGEDGSLLDEGIDTRRIAAVRVLARGESRVAVRVAGVATDANDRMLDSASIEIALRNAR